MAHGEVIMKRSILVLSALVFVSVFLARGSAEASDSKEGPVAYLELCYATSINMPEERYGPENVFDNDPDTYWATMPGAAPDEGLFFAFEEPINISSIDVKFLPGGSGFESISEYAIYINGIEGPVLQLHDWPDYIDTSVKSVFIRIVYTDSMEWDENGIRNTGNLPVGISEVTLLVLDAEGDEIPLQVMPIREVGGRVQASSSLDPVESYNPDFLFDSRPAFGWADGNENSSGEGESLTFLFDQPQRIEQIKVWNGYHRSGTHFDQNERAASFSFGTEGEYPPLYQLEDTMDPQLITLETPLEGSSFTMEFLEVYEGETYKDLVISELCFFNGEEWFVVNSGESEMRKRAILQWAQNTPAGAFIDRQVYAGSYNEYEWDYHLQTLILRSNSSFVIWKTDEREDSVEKMYADGNWQILSDNSVRIFGRLNRVASIDQTYYDPYAGTSPDQGQSIDRMTIFSDTLQFGEGWISSNRGMFEDFTF